MKKFISCILTVIIICVIILAIKIMNTHITSKKNIAQTEMNNDTSFEIHIHEETIQEKPNKVPKDKDKNTKGENVITSKPSVSDRLQETLNKIEQDEKKEQKENNANRQNKTNNQNNQQHGGTVTQPPIYDNPNTDGQLQEPINNR